MRKVKMWFAALASSSLLFAGFAAPASAQPIVTGGVVNITVVDVLNDNVILSNNEINLGVALNLAANICDVNVNALAVQLRDGGATCTIGDQKVDITQSTG
jgi:hypothetical protein